MGLWSFFAFRASILHVTNSEYLEGFIWQWNWLIWKSQISWHILSIFADERHIIGCEFIIVNIFSSHAPGSEPLHVVFNVVPTWINIQLSEVWLYRDANSMIISIRIVEAVEFKSDRNIWTQTNVLYSEFVIRRGSNTKEYLIRTNTTEWRHLARNLKEFFSEMYFDQSWQSVPNNLDAMFGTKTTTV